MLSLFGALRVAFCAAMLAGLLASPAGAATKHGRHHGNNGGGLSVTKEANFGTLPASIDGGRRRPDPAFVGAGSARPAAALARDRVGRPRAQS